MRKPCGMCHVTKPLSEFALNKRDGRASWCRPCFAAYRAANKERIRETQRRWEREHPEQVRATQRAARRRNRERRHVYDRDWRAKHAERLRPIAAAKAREHYRLNTTKCLERAERYSRTHPAKVRATRAAYRARKRNAAGMGASAADVRRIFAASLGLCAYCNERKPLTLDHVDPIALGGRHDEDNLAAACGSCNSSKYNLPLLLWLARAKRKTA